MLNNKKLTVVKWPYNYLMWHTSDSYGWPLHVLRSVIELVGWGVRGPHERRFLPQRTHGSPSLFSESGYIRLNYFVTPSDLTPSSVRSCVQLWFHLNTGHKTFSFSGYHPLPLKICINAFPAYCRISPTPSSQIGNMLMHISPGWNRHNSIFTKRLQELEYID